MISNAAHMEEYFTLAFLFARFERKGERKDVNALVGKKK